MSQNKNCLLRNARSSHFRLFSLPARRRTATGWRRFDRHRLGKGQQRQQQKQRENTRVWNIRQAIIPVTAPPPALASF
jgi:hypothetical protein